MLYHAHCWDGFCSAWLFKQAFPDAEFHPASYGDEPPDVSGKQVFIVDFSYKRRVLSAIAQQASSLVLLDHHKTTIEDLAGMNYEGYAVVLDVNKSGGRLAWEYLYSNRLLPDRWLSANNSGYSLKISPWLVDYTEDRDLWRWKLPHSREINAALRSYPLDFQMWDIFASWKWGGDEMAGFAREGVAILRREKQIIDDHVRHARETEIGDYKGLCVNATVLFSEIAGELAKGRPFGTCYFDRLDGKRQYSLRSEEGGVDVSEIAKRYGGGGHKHAAGFEITFPEDQGLDRANTIAKSV